MSSNAKTALVIGGAGEFGLKIADALRGEKWNVITYDSLIHGNSAALTGTLVKADVHEVPRIMRAINEYNVERIYLCSLLGAGSAVEIWDRQLSHLMSVLQSMKKTSVRNLTVFLPEDSRSEILHRLLNDVSGNLKLNLKILPWNTPVAAAL